MRSLPRLWALLLAVALLPLLRAFEGDPHEGLEAVASQTDVVSRPDPSSVVANREDKARRMFRLRDGTAQRDAWAFDGEDAPTCAFDDDDEPETPPAAILHVRGPPDLASAVPDIGPHSARGPPV